VLVIASGRALTVAYLGRLEEADREFERLEHTVRAFGGPELSLQLAQYRVENAELRGDERLAMQHAQAMLAQMERVEGTYWVAGCYGYLGRAHLLAGRLDPALEAFERCAEVVEGLGLRETLVGSMHLPYLAEACRRAGTTERALATAQAAVALSHSGGNAVLGARTELLFARISLQMEGPSSQAFVQALANAARLVEETGARAFQPHVHEVRAECAALQGDSDTRQRELREAHRLFTEMGATGHAERLARELEAQGG
jgi:tetratricopeptide (TPR) repeat protein